MVDHLSPEQRSWNMSRIRSRDTRPEIMVRSMLHRAGYRFRLHCQHLPGRPDVVLPRFKTAVFINGCFWHRHTGCKLATMPKSKSDFWQKKFDANVRRDHEQFASLSAIGWYVQVLWECQIKNNPANTIGRLIEQLERNR
jgi:DNA mismatch endonuclease (patch repair protein)